MSFNSFAPFIDNIDLREVNNYRTLEELVTERYESINENKPDYTNLFNKIVSRLNNLEIKHYPDIFNCETVKDYKDFIYSFKENSSTIYMEFIEAENLLKYAKEKYKHFCDTIKECIKSINNSGTFNENDESIKDIFDRKIDEYYHSLKLDDLLKNFNTKFEEFEKLKYKISLIVGSFLPTTICQICLENQVDYFIDPCGHTICKSCKLVCENKSTACHYCRASRNSYKRLYL